MELKMLADACGGGTCPTLYETDRGTVVVQGYVLDSDTLSKLGLPEGEAAVEIPRELLAAAGIAS